MSFFDLSEIQLAIIESSPRCGKTKIISIDGPAGSGKTTLAAELSVALFSTFGDVPIIHLDQLYEGWDGALDSKLFERIDSWILTPIRNGLPPKYLEYDWHLGAYSKWIELALIPILIIEGVGAGHTSLRGNISKAIWVEADDHMLLDRVIERDGDAIRDEMVIWKIKEQEYFEFHNVKSSAQIKIKGQ